MPSPQSLNRYSYVQNDPVNFVDPSGLDPDIGRFIADPSIGVLDSPVRGGTLTSLAGLIGGFGGSLLDEPSPIDVGGSPDPEPPPQTDPLPFNSCAQFVDYLVERTVDYSNQVLQKGSKAIFLGLEMMNTAYYDYERHIHNRFDGFKRELTEAGEGTPSGAQGAGVYGHIFFSGGSWLAGKGNFFVYGANAFNEIKDRGQGLFGSDQYASEVAGNRAGRNVGRHMWNFLSGATPREENRLRNSLTSELCQ